ncbi:MAG: hypothetical protein OXB99_00955 [Acidimicrobiaceae bacterium]|nr:hypothetical protein [Acidimicrobiaceae bacterium]
MAWRAVLAVALTFALVAALPASSLAQAQPAGAPLNESGPPSVAEGPILNSPRSGGVYGLGEQIKVVLTFSEPVIVTGTPRIGVIVGERRRWANYSESTRGGRPWPSATRCRLTTATKTASASRRTR